MKLFLISASPYSFYPRGGSADFKRITADEDEARKMFDELVIERAGRGETIYLIELSEDGWFEADYRDLEWES